MTSEDEEGHYVLTHHAHVTLRFANIVLRQLRWFNSQNVLSELLIEEVDPAAGEGHLFSVSFGSSWGVEADLLCDRLVVESVEPFVRAAGT